MLYDYMEKLFSGNKDEFWLVMQKLEKSLKKRDFGFFRKLLSFCRVLDRDREVTIFCDRFWSLAKETARFFGAVMSLERL